MDYNRRSAPDPRFQLLGLLLKASDGGTIGGLWGRSAYEWLFIELLFIPEELRGTGLGRTLMQQAEQVARDRHCTGVWLDTFAFQALGFYQKLGYTVFGERTTPAASPSTGSRSASTAQSPSLPPAARKTAP